MNIRTLLFDNDGTLYPMPPGFTEAVRDKMVTYLARLLQMPVCDVRAERQRLIKKYGVECTEYVFAKEHGVDTGAFLQHTYLSVDLGALNVESEPGLEHTLRGITLSKSVLTNNPSQFADRILRRVGIRDLFTHIIGAAEMAYVLKPAEQAYRVALDITGYAAASTLFVDDTIEHIVAARRMGMHTALIDRTGTISGAYRTCTDACIGALR